MTRLDFAAFAPRGDRLSHLSAASMERFWSKVDKHAAGGCWLWTANLRCGYGRFRVGAGLVSAHRLSWELAHGPVEGDLLVLHNCPTGDNAACVNPAHLWLGTQLENVADRDAKGRQRTPRGEQHPARVRARLGLVNPTSGEANVRSKLTEAVVRSIRAEVESGESRKAIARRLGVASTTVDRIAARRMWRHVA